MFSNIKRDLIVAELIVTGRKRIFSFFLAQNVKVSKDVRTSCTQFYYENSKPTRALTNCI